MNDVAAVQVEVDALGHDRTRNEHVGEERGVEGEHEALALLALHRTVDEPDRRSEALRLAILVADGDVPHLDLCQAGQVVPALAGLT